MRALGGEPEVADDLEAGRLILPLVKRADRAPVISPSYGPLQSRSPGQDAFRADVEASGAGAALALAVGLAEI